MKNLITLLLVLFTSVNLSLFAQSINELNILDPTTNPGGYLDVIPLPAAKQKGSIYDNKDFLPGKLLLKSGPWIDHVKLRYDLQNNLLEIETENGDIKICELASLNQYDIIKFDADISRNLGKDTYVRIENSIYKILYGSDNFKLGERTYIESKKPNYNPVLDVGSKDIQHIKIAKLYVILNQQTYEIKRNPNSISKIHNIDIKSIKKYIKENNLDIKRDDSFAQVIEYCLNNS